MNRVKNVAATSVYGLPLNYRRPPRQSRAKATQQKRIATFEPLLDLEQRVLHVTRVPFISQVFRDISIG